MTSICLAVRVDPAMVSVLVRAAPVLAASEYVTCPGPVPEAPAVRVIQFALPLAVHPQPTAAVTVTA